jgi:serine/threonine protein kinase
MPSKSIINNIYIKNNSENEEKNKLYSSNSSQMNSNNINNMNNQSSKNISSEGYQFNCDNYNIVHLLGEGTFGKIYLVEDPADLKKYALKKIAVSDMEELGENKKEFELLMKLSQENPNLNVVKIFGIQVKKLDKFNLVMYVLMEAAQCDWENEIRNRNQYQAFYTEEELMKILTNLASTLASLQKMGICHRDVKPQNILCFGKDNYKLSDFGEAKKKKKRKINGNCIYDFEGDTSKQTVRGTELYMSPILFKALHDCPEVDLEYNAYKSDVFSLGLCMLLSSTLGFQALYDIRELYDNNKIKKIVEKYLSSRYSKEYIKLITSMLQIKEKNRPDFVELEAFIQSNYYHN